jgi:hypothetical protein
MENEDAVTIPKRIKIRREKGYHTDHVGKCQNGNQFMAFIVAARPENMRSPGYRKLNWYAVVHLFNSHGDYLGTETVFLGKAVWAKELKVMPKPGWPR